MKVAVVTGIFNPKNNIRIKYSKYYKEYDYYCFTCDSDKIAVDSNIKRVVMSSDSWDSKYAARRAGKMPKMLQHLLLPDYDVYVWCDATHEISVGMTELKSILGENDCAMFKHPQRDCVYDELNVVSRDNLDHSSLLNETRNWLSSIGFEGHKGLYEMTTFVRRNNKKCNNAFSVWYSLVARLSSRDQLTFMPCSFKYDLSIATLPGSAQMYNGGNEVFSQVRHSLRLTKTVS